MITYLDAKKQAKRDGVGITQADFAFAMYYVQGMDISQCYVMSNFLSQKEKKTPKNGKKKEEGEVSYSMKKRAKDISETDAVKYLKVMLRPHFVEDVKKFVLENIDDFDFIPSTTKKGIVESSIINKLVKAGEVDGEDLTDAEIKTFLTILIRDKKGNIKDVEVKDIVALLKLYTDRYGVKKEDDDFGKYFIEIHEKCNVVCRKCGRETTFIDGFVNICEHCGEKDDLTKKK